MKQKFRDSLPSGAIKTKYWIVRSAGTFGHWHAIAEDVISQILETVRYYEKIGINLTNRQLYYQLVGKDYIPNFQEVYKKICTIITDMRYAGLIDWETIEDKARVANRHAQWDNISKIIDTAVYAYRLPRWEDQPNYIEMFCEKEAGINVLEKVCREHHIHFGFNKGYSSASALYKLAKRLTEQIENKKKCVVLYFGDHDASGLDMIRDIRDRITEFLGGMLDGWDLWEKLDEETAALYLEPYEEQGLDESFCLEMAREDYVEGFVREHFKIVPVALTMDQIKKYNPPPNPAKMSDPRAKWYIEKYGNVSWELDAIDALELRKIAKESILEYLDQDLYNAWIAREEEEKKALIKFGKSLV